MALGLVCLIASPVRATVLLPADMPEVARAAAAITVGRVVAVTTRLEPGTRRIERVITLEVTQYLKGGLGREVHVAVPGGQMGHYRTVMVGAPEFAPGDEVVLFLATRAAGLPYVVGLHQGAYRITLDTRSGTRVVSPAPLVRDPDTTGAVAVRRGDPARRPLALDAFAAEVRRALAEPASRVPRRAR